MCECSAFPRTILFAASRYDDGIREAWPSVPRVRRVAGKSGMVVFLDLPLSLQRHPFFVKPRHNGTHSLVRGFVI